MQVQIHIIVLSEICLPIPVSVSTITKDIVRRQALSGAEYLLSTLGAGLTAPCNLQDWGSEC